MGTRDLICICCPLGCPLTVTFKEDAASGSATVTGVAGNTCPRGDTYAKKEVTNPTRIVTSVIRVVDGVCPMINVKTASAIPKDKMFACIEALKDISARAPIKIGDILLADVAGTGVDVIAARNVDAK